MSITGAVGSLIYGNGQLSVMNSNGSSGGGSSSGSSSGTSSGSSSGTSSGSSSGTSSGTTYGITIGPTDYNKVFGISQSSSNNGISTTLNTYVSVYNSTNISPIVYITPGGYTRAGTMCDYNGNVYKITLSATSLNPNITNMNFTGFNFVAVEAMTFYVGEFTIGLTDTGKLYYWDYEQNSTGNGYVQQTTPTPVELPMDTGVTNSGFTQIVSHAQAGNGYPGALFALKDGSVYGYGSNVYSIFESPLVNSYYWKLKKINFYNATKPQTGTYEPQIKYMYLNDYDPYPVLCIIDTNNCLWIRGRLPLFMIRKITVSPYTPIATLNAVQYNVDTSYPINLCTFDTLHPLYGKQIKLVSFANFGTNFTIIIDINDNIYTPDLTPSLIHNQLTGIPCQTILATSFLQSGDTITYVKALRKLSTDGYSCGYILTKNKNLYSLRIDSGVNYVATITDITTTYSDRFTQIKYTGGGIFFLT